MRHSHYNLKSSLLSNFRESNGCLLWIGSVDRDGYGVTWDPSIKNNNHSHVVYFRTFMGPLPVGYHLHHTCNNKRCARHIEIISGFDHVDKHVRERCRNGHEYTTENTHLYRGIRMCKICMKARWDRSNLIRSLEK